MHQGPVTAFDDVPRHAGGHFVLCLYAAIYRLVNHVRRLSETGGASLEEVFEKYPFLADYFVEMRKRMPQEITWGAGTEWWRQQIETWEATCPQHLPLRALSAGSGLCFVSRLAFMVAGLVEEDSRFGTLFAELQQPLTYRRPTLELTGQILIDEAMVGEADPWTICRPLLAAGLLDAPNQLGPRTEWVLRTPPLLWDAARGQVSDQPAPWCCYAPPARFPSTGELIFPEEFLRRLGRLPGLIHERQLRTLALRSGPGTDTEELAGAVAKTLGKGIVVVPLPVETNSEAELLLGPLCNMANAVPVLRCEPGPGDTVNLPPLRGYEGPVMVTLGLEGGLGGTLAEGAVTIQVPSPGAALREAYWRRAFSSAEIEGLDEIRDRFHLGGGFIRRVAKIAMAQAALDGRRAVRPADVNQACRTLNRQLLDTLAARLEAKGTWSDLVASPATTEKLAELERRCRYREKLLARLGPAFGNGCNRGVRALLTGASGTGKTLAAKILAAELGMDLYRVDLAAVVNKYIGEPEKNLHQVLTRAEALDVVLLLDEGDALLGHRTEVKSANDRYANLETNYLLQRLENYQGIVLVTTNLGENIDAAFQRRMDVLVPFFPPQAEERWQILLLHLPPDHDVDEAFLQLAARRCALTGGQLRNAVLHATLLALEEGAAVDRRHLEQGLRSEYRKAGGTFPLDGAGDYRERDGGMGSFLAALARG